MTHMRIPGRPGAYCEGVGRCTSDFKKVTCPACRAIRRELADK